MTASEFSFLALGLVLGLVSGAAIIEFVRARPPTPREVRLTVSHDAIPRRSATLADDAFTVAGPEPARGGPADRRLIGSPLPVGASDRRTTVRFAPATASGGSGGGGSASIPGAIPIARDPSPPGQGRIMEPALPLPGTSSSGPAGSPGRVVGIPISSGDDPVMSAIRGGPTAVPAAVAVAAAVNHQTMTAQTQPSPGAAPAAVGASTAVALLDAPMAARRGSKSATPAPSSAAAAAPPADAASAPVAGERCAEERRIANERCELATRARALADAATDALRLAQRAYDAHEAAAVTASWGADPRAVHDAKDAAQGGFRSAVQAARTPEALEIAARDWLNEINRINMDARDAIATADREHAAAAAIGATLERLGLEADAARIGAENADVACLKARVAVADCDEQSATVAAAASHTAADDQPWTPRLEEDETLGRDSVDGLTPRIFRLLRGDRQAMTTLVASLADDDAEARRRWQLQMTGLIEAIVADAIEASALEFPDGHPFWGGFAPGQSREIVHALSSLGFRFDGLGGWTDERYPTQRDLSLALGYAGIDPMRIRHWPKPDETSALFHDVTVAADEYLAETAGDLTLAEMVTMLGRRADGLADVWNNWGRIRPLLLEDG